MAESKTKTKHTREHGSHGASHENGYLTSSNKNDAGVRITRIGLYVNLGMAIAKGIGGWYFNSKALSADAIHSLTDLVSDVMTLATVSWALRPPNEAFPAGYGKVESLGSLGVSGILLIGGAFMGWSAILQLVQEFLPGFAALAENIGFMGHSHSHGAVDDLGPNINAAWLAGGSILIKEWLYRATIKVARERKSSVLASNAYHHRVDSLTALVALLMIAGSNVLKNATWMDPIGGLIISLMVVQAGLGNTKASILELIDVNIDAGMRRRVTKAASAGLAEMSASVGASAVEIRGVQGTKAGQSYLLDIELGVPASWTVTQTRAVEDAVRHMVGAKVRGVKRVKIVFVGGESVHDEFIPSDISPRSSPEPDSEDQHDHEHEHSNGHNHPHSR